LEFVGQCSSASSVGHFLAATATRDQQRQLAPEQCQWWCHDLGLHCHGRLTRPTGLSGYHSLWSAWLDWLAGVASIFAVSLDCYRCEQQSRFSRWRRQWWCGWWQ